MRYFNTKLDKCGKVMYNTLALVCRKKPIVGPMIEKEAPEPAATKADEDREYRNFGGCPAAVMS